MATYPLNILAVNWEDYRWRDFVWFIINGKITSLEMNRSDRICELELKLTAKQYKAGSLNSTHTWRVANMSLTTWSWRWCMMSFLLFSSACNSSFSRIRVSRSSCMASRSHCKRSHSCLRLSRSFCKSTFSCYKKRLREKHKCNSSYKFPYLSPLKQMSQDCCEK